MRVDDLLRLALGYAMRLGWVWWLWALMAALFASSIYLIVTVGYAGAYAQRGRASLGVACSIFLLVGYAVLVLAFTVLARAPRALERPLNLDLFGTLAQRLRPGSANDYEILLNMALFVPIGVFLPTATRWHCASTVFASCVFSVSIEVLQIALSRGTCELSDIFTNVVGALVGYALHHIAGQMLCKEHRHRLGVSDDQALH